MHKASLENEVGQNDLRAVEKDSGTFITIFDANFNNTAADSLDGLAILEEIDPGRPFRNVIEQNICEVLRTKALQRRSNIFESLICRGKDQGLVDVLNGTKDILNLACLCEGAKQGAEAAIDESVLQKRRDGEDCVDDMDVAVPALNILERR